MIYALKKIGEPRIKATKGERAICPFCQTEVIARCGEINEWHWAHKTKQICDPWQARETKWHLDQKKQFDERFTEVTIKKGNEKHIADVAIPLNPGQQTDLFNKQDPQYFVFEFQNSPISPETIREREGFYQNMAWVFNLWKRSDDQFQFLNSLLDDGYLTFRWKHAKKSVLTANRKVFLDLYNSSTLLLVRRFYSEKTPVTGWGYSVKMAELVQTAMRNEKEDYSTDRKRYLEILFSITERRELNDKKRWWINTFENFYMDNGYLSKRQTRILQKFALT